MRGRIVCVPSVKSIPAGARGSSPKPRRPPDSSLSPLPTSNLSANPGDTAFRNNPECNHLSQLLASPWSSWGVGLGYLHNSHVSRCRGPLRAPPCPPAASMGRVGSGCQQKPSGHRSWKWGWLGAGVGAPTVPLCPGAGAVRVRTRHSTSICS